jgi:hypothetical protein
MGPVNHHSMFINRCLAFITASLVVLGEKLGGRPTDWSADVRRIVAEALFLGSSRVHQTLLDQRERLPRTKTAHRKCMSGEHGLTREAYVSCLSDFFCRVYINSNHRDSRI